MPDFRWVKWRTRHAAGPSSWRYDMYDISDYSSDPEKALNAIVREIAEENNTFSDKYRGADADYEDPPYEILAKEYDKQGRHVEHEFLKFNLMRRQLKASKPSFAGENI